MATNFPSSLDNFTNPTSANHLSDGPVLHSAQHANTNDAIEAIEAKTGIDFSNVTNSIDFITKLLLMATNQHQAGGYREIVGGIFPTTITWYTDASKAVKLVEKEYVYSPTIRILPLTISVRLYNGTISNTLRRTITDTITYTKVFEVSRTRTIT